MKKKDLVAQLRQLPEDTEIKMIDGSDIDLSITREVRQGITFVQIKPFCGCAESEIKGCCKEEPKELIQ